MTNDKGHPISMRFSVVAGFHKNDISNWAKKHLFPGTSVVSDGLNCFPAVKDAGCDHHAIIKSGLTTSMEYSEFKWVDTMIGNVKNSIHSTYHAISEKHVPRYLAEFCFVSTDDLNWENDKAACSGCSKHIANATATFEAS